MSRLILHITLFTLYTTILSSVSAQKGVFLAPQPHKLLYADTVYREAIAKKDTLLLAEAYYLYGKTYEVTGDILLSNQWYYKALRILEPRGDSKALSRLYLRLNAYGQRSYAESMRLTRKGMDMAKRLNDNKNLARAYGHMKSIHERDWSDGGKKPNLPKPHLDSGMYYLQKVATIGQQTGDSGIIVGTKRDIAFYKWHHYRDTSRVFEYLNIAIKYYANQKESGELMSTRIELAQIYLDLNRPELALAELDEAKRIYDRNPFNVNYLLSQFQNSYSRYYRLTGNWKKAYEMNEAAHQQQIGNYTADREGAISRLGKEYEIEKKDILLKAKDTELALRDNAFIAQRRFTIVSFILLLVTAVMSLVFYRLYKKNLHISKQNGLLVKEQNHRVKNNLQAISSLLSLQSEELTDPQALRAIEESRLRVEAIGILHRKLYDGRQLAMVYLPDFLKDLTIGVLDTYGFDDLTAEFNVDEIYLPPDLAVHLGLIVNELLTNACKYAFPDNDSPELRITCNSSMKRKQKNVHLEVADNGPGLSFKSNRRPLKAVYRIIGREQHPSEAPSATHSGFGMKLIQMETEQLYATSDFHYDNGTVFTMDFSILPPNPNNN